jgi:hypothetical protein
LTIARVSNCYHSGFLCFLLATCNLVNGYVSFDVPGRLWRVLITHMHIRSTCKRIGLGIVNARLLRVRAASDDETSILKLAHARAKHVMVRVRHLTLRYGSRLPIVVGKLRVASRTAKGCRAPGRENQQSARVRCLGDDVGSYGDDGKADQIRPLASRRRRRCNNLVDHIIFLVIHPLIVLVLITVCPLNLVL